MYCMGVAEDTMQKVKEPITEGMTAYALHLIRAMQVIVSIIEIAIACKLNHLFVASVATISKTAVITQISVKSMLLYCLNVIGFILLFRVFINRGNDNCKHYPTI